MFPVAIDFAAGLFLSFLTPFVKLNKKSLSLDREITRLVLAFLIGLDMKHQALIVVP